MEHWIQIKTLEQWMLIKIKFYNEMLGKNNFFLYF